MTDESIATPDSPDAEQPTQDYGTDGVGQEELSDGNHQPEEIDYKERYVAQRKSAEQMLTEKKQVELENMQLKQQMMMNQQQQAFQPGFAHQQPQQAFQPQQAPPPQEAPPLEYFLSDQERSALNKAEDDLDLRAANKIRDMALSRRDGHIMQNAQQASQQVFSQAAAATLRNQSQIEFIKQNKDIFDDPAAGQAVFQNALSIQNDPVQAVALELNPSNQAEWIPINGQMVNKKALNTAIIAHRGFSADAKKTGVRIAHQTTAPIIGGTQRVSGEPGSGGPATFNPSTHLSSSERDALQRFNRKSSALPNWKQNGFKAYWDSLGKDMQKARLKEGRAITQKEFEERYAR